MDKPPSPAPDPRTALVEALTSLRNECRGLLGAFHNELVVATSVTNVRVLERKVADADATLRACADELAALRETPAPKE